MKTLLLEIDEIAVIFLVGLSVGAIVLSIYLTRALFSIPLFLKLKKAEVALLVIIAKRNASEYERNEIEEIESNLRS